MGRPRDRKGYNRRLGQLVTGRTSWIDHYRELGDYLLPRRVRFKRSERNKGTKKNDKIVNNTGVLALRTLSSGMMAGITSPARPWFRLVTPSPDLNKKQTVRSWLSQVERVLREIFARSNLYLCLNVLYRDLGAFGTSNIIIEEDDEDVIRCYVPPVGSYAVGVDSSYRPDSLYRETTMTALQLVERFAEVTGEGDNAVVSDRGAYGVSEPVKNAYRRGDMEQVFDVVQVFEKNEGYDPNRGDAAGMQWRSVWFEPGNHVENNLLGEGGYHDRASITVRWEVTGEDTYGGSPGMDALPDVKQLQLMEKRKLEAIGKMVNPPMNAPADMKHERMSIMEGEVTFVTARSGQQKFEPSHDVHPGALQIQEETIRIEQRIRSTFFADLFLMLASSALPTMTAREVDERHEEKMLQLGPVLERLHDELLDPIIDRAFGIAVRNGLIPDPPEELQGRELNVEYISILAQAQKLLETVGVERLSQFIAGLAQVKEDVSDKLDFEGTVDEYSELLGVNPKLVRSDDEVEELRQQRQQQIDAEQAALAAQTARDAGAGVKSIADAGIENDDALPRLLEGIGAA